MTFQKCTCLTSLSSSYHTQLTDHSDHGFLTGKGWSGENGLGELQVIHVNHFAAYQYDNYILGMFGSGVASYFKLLRWLCLLNLTLTIFIFSFICIPQVSTLCSLLTVVMLSMLQLIYNEEGLEPTSNYTYPVSLIVDGEVRKSLLYEQSLYSTVWCSSLGWNEALN